MGTQFNRRSFLRGAGSATGLAVLSRRLIAGSGETPPSDTVRMAVVGIGGQGRFDVEALGDQGQVIAYADVDPRMIEKARAMLPQAKAFEDYREMYDKMGKDIDAVIVATPDHWHTLPALEAMQRGKHVYVEKPLARTIWEVRRLMAAALKIQRRDADGQPGPFPGEQPDFCVVGSEGAFGAYQRSAHLDHDAAALLQEQAWRGRHARGTAGGAQLGQVGRSCRVPSVQQVVHAEPLARVDAIRHGNSGRLGMPPAGSDLHGDGPQGAKDHHGRGYAGLGSQHRPAGVPDASRVTFQYELPNRETLKVLWHDGEFCNEVPRPPMLEEGRDLGNRLKQDASWNAGAVVYGTENTVTYGSHGAASCRVIPEEKMRGLIQTKALSEFKNLGIGDHFRDFVTAIRTGRQAGSRFAFAGVLTEAALLGSIAIRNPGVKLEWDAASMTITNSKAANAMVTPEYRKGYELKGA